MANPKYTLATRFDNYVKEEFTHFAFCKVKRNPRVIANPGKLDEYMIQTLIDQVLEQGRYISYWRMASPSGKKFGQCIWVDASVKETLRESIRNLNLNLPPELKFPINDNLLVGNGASTSLPNSAGPSVSYPIIDLSYVGPALPSVLPAMLYQLPQPTSSAAPVAGANESAVDLPGKKQVEEKLLRELDEMGFK
ncbi:UNVERIFIED_CONTAM: protein JOKA2 [Sesamum latifolium]|uniref:Protein JOKA2 n=1 Tax=Sesamum latifolium TaxID=2727402 RepID=A0AAW2UIM9_9LAMI